MDAIVIWPVGRRSVDKDAVFKMLLDCLVSANVIPDDSPKVCQPGLVHYAKATAAHEAWGTVINLSEAFF